MDRTQKTEIVNMCMVYDKNFVLVQNKIHDEWGGLTFPGGHVEKDESLSDAVIREVFEETGLTIEDPVLCGTKQFQTEEDARYVVFFFRASKFSGTLTASSEGAVFWIDRKDLPKYPLSMDMLAMVEVMERQDLSEFYYCKENGNWKYKLL